MWVCHTQPTSSGGHQLRSVSGLEEISARRGSQNFSYLNTRGGQGLGESCYSIPVDGTVDDRPVVEVFHIIHFLQELQFQQTSLARENMNQNKAGLVRSPY